MIMRKKMLKYIGLVTLLSPFIAACDSMPGNNSDKYRFYQELNVQSGTSGQADAAYRGGGANYEIHENNYYGGSNAGTTDYRSNYEPYKPYEGYKVGDAKQYYRGETE